MRTVSGTMRTVIPVRPGNNFSSRLRISLRSESDMPALRSGNALLYTIPISDGYRYGDRVSPACQENVYKEGSPFPALSDPPRYLELGRRKTVTQMTCTARHNFIRAESHLKLSSFPVNTSFRNIQLPLINGLEVTGQGSFEELLPHRFHPSLIPYQV